MCKMFSIFSGERVASCVVRGRDYLVLYTDNFGRNEFEIEITIPEDRRFGWFSARESVGKSTYVDYFL